MAHGAAHDAAKHVTAPFVGWQNAVGNEKACGAQMIGDDAMRYLVFAFGRHARRRNGRCDQRLEQVDLVIIVRAL